jgi:hypothetical protein
MNIFDIFEKKVKAGTGLPDLPDISKMADQLLKEGKISGEQAAQLKDWDSIRPDAKATPAKFESWMKLRPNISVQQPPSPAPVSEAPIVNKPEENAKPVTGVLDLPDFAEMADKLANEGKISQMQAFQLKTWNSVRPDINASRAKFDAWLKAKPDVDIPGL